MKKLVITLLVLFFIISIGYGLWKQAPEKVALIPLDSRPCNTQFPELLGQMTNKQIVIPYNYLDNFLEPAETESLWSWLEANGKSFEKIIINTNQLFNGGLIASREPQSYTEIKGKISRLEAFCRQNRGKKIIVITILPRLLPSQFTHLWDYQELLIDYAQQIDKNSLEGKPFPDIPGQLPENIWKEYFSIYENTYDLVKSLIEFTEEGLIDHYLIGQDDAEQYGLSNKIIRDLKPLFNEKVRFVHGADELTMLALVRELAFKEKPNFTPGYTNKEFLNVYFPFEAAPLEEVINTKLDYLGFSKDVGADVNFIVHTDPQKVDALLHMLEKSQASYLGVMDIAFTNKGDIELLEILLSPEKWPKVKGYAGWNTAGNTIGTELSHAAAYQYLEERYPRFTKKEQIEALEAYIKFRYIRLAEDLIYQGILRQELNERLTQLNIDPLNIGEKHSTGNKILAELFIPYEEKLRQVFLGEYTIGKIKFRVENISALIELPWSRTFEAKVVPEVTIKIE